MLAIEVTFLTGRYVATSYNDRRSAEWPPHPARFYSALVATHFADAVPSTDEREVLAWLEAQEPPALTVSEASRRDVVTVFVPVNDSTVLKDFDAQSDAVDDVRHLARGGDKKAQKALPKLEQKLAEAIAKDIGVPASLSKEGLKTAQAQLPESRVRQPRTFPSVTPHEPHVTFIWAKAIPTDAQKAVLDRLLSRLVRLGHSSSLVSARLIDSPPMPTYVPSEHGERLRTTRMGQLDALEDAFSRHNETEPRVMPARFQSYASPVTMTESFRSATAFGTDWLVLRRVEGAPLPMVAGPNIARVVRAALMSGGGDEIPEIISGHKADGSRSERDHLAIVPLPFVGHRHADGGILGVALVLPRTISSEERKSVYRALARWESRARSESINLDVAADAPPALPLTLGKAGVWWVERIEDSDKRINLRPKTWCEPAKVWASVTPVALDRHPGDLRTRDQAKLDRALAEAEETLARACVRIGLPIPRFIEVLPAAPFAGAAKVRHYEPFQHGQDARRRALVHVRLTFEVPVLGPVLLGAGRYQGLGLFRPELPLEETTHV